jgi:hypothetical protein
MSKQDSLELSDTESETSVTLESIINNNKKRQRSPDQSPASIPEIKQKKEKMVKIDPILIIKNKDTKFEKTDWIEFDSDIMNKTGANIKITMFDKYGNLLIYPLSEEDCKKIMNCNELFYGCVKKNLNNKDNRPKAVIIGLSYSLADKYLNELQEHGIVEIINLAKPGLLKETNIVKVVFDTEENADKLINEAQIEIRNCKFDVAEERKKIIRTNTNVSKLNLNVNKPSNESSASNSSGIEAILLQLSKDKEELYSRLEKLDVNSKTLEKNIIKSNLTFEQKVNESMQQNNMKLASAIIDIFNSKLDTKNKIPIESVKAHIQTKCNDQLEADKLVIKDKINDLQ